MRIRRWAVLAVVGLASVSACGGDDDDEGSPDTTAGSDASTPATGGAAGEEVTLTVLVGDDGAAVATAEGLAEAYTALHPNVTFDIETRPGGAEGDNLVKTRLATGEMSDIFCYNSGSLLQALNPDGDDRRHHR